MSTLHELKEAIDAGAYLVNPETLDFLDKFDGQYELEEVEEGGKTRRTTFTDFESLFDYLEEEDDLWEVVSPFDHEVTPENIQDEPGLQGWYEAWRKQRLAEEWKS